MKKLSIVAAAAGGLVGLADGECRGVWLLPQLRGREPGCGYHTAAGHTRQQLDRLTAAIWPGLTCCGYTMPPTARPTKT